MMRSQGLELELKGYETVGYRVVSKHRLGTCDGDAFSIGKLQLEMCLVG